MRSFQAEKKKSPTVMSLNSNKFWSSRASRTLNSDGTLQDDEHPTYSRKDYKDETLF